MINMKFNKPITVTRSIIHDKRIAPKGSVFLICKASIWWNADQTRTFTKAVLLNTQGVTDEQEAEIKEKLSEQMSEYLKTVA